MDSIIKRLQDKNNRKNFALLQSCFKTAFLKKIPKGPFVEKIENEIFLLYWRAYIRERMHARMRARFYI